MYLIKMNITEKLIALVKQHPCLYDTKNVEYKNYNREQLWDQVAKELNCTREETKTKWKNLKDGYTKFKKQTTNPNSTSKNYVHWVWGPHLEFLYNYISKRNRRPSKKTIPKHEVTDDSSESNTSTNELYEPEIYYEPESILSTKRSASDDDDDEEKSSKYYKKSKQDAADLLFASYAETFRKFRPGTQTSVKLKMAQIFAEAEMIDMETNNVVAVNYSPIII